MYQLNPKPLLLRIVPVAKLADQVCAYRVVNMMDDNDTLFYVNSLPGDVTRWQVYRNGQGWVRETFATKDDAFTAIETGVV